jgi:hypothetical protein
LFPPLRFTVVIIIHNIWWGGCFSFAFIHAIYNL